MMKDDLTKVGMRDRIDDLAELVVLVGFANQRNVHNLAVGIEAGHQVVAEPVERVFLRLDQW